MTIVRRAGKSTFAALLSAALVLWSVLPTTSHAPAVFETIHDHLEMIAEHGHSHGFEEDLYWAMHGHSHDAADHHDHSQALLTLGDKSHPVAVHRDTWRLRAAPGGAHLTFRIDRPPRA